MFLFRVMEMLGKQKSQQVIFFVSCSVIHVINLGSSFPFNSFLGTSQLDDHAE